MESEFLQKVSNYFTTEFKQQIALSLDEDVAGIDRALSAIIPIGFAATEERAENVGNHYVYDLSKSASAYFPASPDVAKLHNEEEGGRLAGDILGAHHHAVTEAVANYAGIKTTSAGALFLLAIPVLIGSLGIYADENNMSPEQLNQFLIDQKSSIPGWIPEGIRPVASVYHVGNDHVDEKHITASVTPAATVKKNNNWIINLVIILVAVALLIYFSRGCDKPPKDMSDPAVDTTGVSMISTSPFLQNVEKSAFEGRVVASI